MASVTQSRPPVGVEQAAGRAPVRRRSPWAPIALAAAVAVPATLAIAGLIIEGVGAISWPGVFVWGLVATFLMTLLGVAGNALGLTRLDLLDLLGSAIAPSGSTFARVVGFIGNHVNGVLLAVAWAYGVALVGWPATWWSGLVWGVLLTGLALVVLTTAGSVHPAIKRGAQEDPGPAGTHMGRLTPAANLLGHLVYGGLLGLLYQTWPLG